MNGFLLRIRLEKDDLKSSLELRKEGVQEKDFSLLAKIIDKAFGGDVDVTKPLNKFLNNEELSFLINHGWLIKDAQFSISSSELLEYYEEKGPLGGIPQEAAERWPHVPSYEIGNVNTKILYHEEKLCPTRYVSCNRRGGYVLKKYYKQNQELLREVDEKRRNDSVDEYMKNSSKKKSKVEKISKPIIQKKSFTKSDQKKFRKLIIEKAEHKDTCNIGFKDEFISSLSEDEKSYMSSLSDLQTKLMRSEVLKK